MNTEQIFKSIDSKEPAMLKFLETLVNIDSAKDSLEGIHQVAEHIKAKLVELGFDAKLVETPGAATHVFGHKAAKDPNAKKVMIMGHMDTVFPKGTVAARPFTIKERKAFGPGVLDMKSGITVGLFALEAMYEDGWQDKDITVFFCGDEETAHPFTNAGDLFEDAADE